MYTSSNLVTAPVADKAKCEANSEANDPRTETLRRALQNALDYGAEPYVARASGVCLGSVRKQIEGSQRLAASTLRAVLLLRAPDEQAELVSLWLGIPLRHEP